ncbi:substrate-binding domain-containing protein [Rhodococcus tibetensis]|uniref:Substrate-binding and VWA domain-containing protein n=1 Tax=Rhodococcus tibetensis TaxID=2965064 RepID=A0ABT1QD45_9NOCA|nr:substrate-binding domain-containing protein [Rhodococcus sp. FXJ9.536]MCQ4120122.1 substrate-binding and VWA domain-containing protein [Rhodococcus sp. FXJ9.536]
MGNHRGGKGARGISKGPLIVLGLVVVIVLGVFGWFQLADRIDDQGAAAAGACVEGDSVLSIAADPDIASDIRTLADRFTATSPVIRDHCISVTVTPVASDAVRDALIAGPEVGWDDNLLGPRPALWIPSSSQSIRQAPAGAVSGEARPLAASPVVLAVRSEFESALNTAAVDWKDLPSLQSGRGSLAALGLPNWGSLGLALPVGSGSAVTELAIEAVAASVAGDSAGPVTAEQAHSPQVTSALTGLALGYEALPGAKPETTREALTLLTDADDPSTEGIHAVPVTEQQLYLALRDAPGSDVTAFMPNGATPVADHPAAILSGPAVDETQSRAAAQFTEFVREPEQGQVLADAGFRIEGLGRPDDTALTFPGFEARLVPADSGAAAEMMRVVRNPVTERTSTILLDVSRSMGAVEGVASRLANTTTALAAQIGRSPDASSLGLWEYSTNLDGTRPYTTVVATGPLSAGGFTEGTRRQALDARLAKAAPAAGTATYASLEAAYESAVAGFTAGRTNSVLLLTDGANDDGSLTRADLLASLAAAGDPSKPVRIDVVTIGENPDLNTLQAVADRTGGSLEKVASSDGPALATAISKLLS